jgi:hypothetical protein
LQPYTVVVNGKSRQQDGISAAPAAIAAGLAKISF